MDFIDILNFSLYFINIITKYFTMLYQSDILQNITCAILVSLVKLDLIEEALTSKERFIEMVYGKRLVQGSLF